MQPSVSAQYICSKQGRGHKPTSNVGRLTIGHMWYLRSVVQEGKEGRGEEDSPHPAGIVKKVRESNVC